MNAMKQPPRLAEQFLKWFLAPHLLETVLGDLNEEFHYQLKTVGERACSWQYWWEVLGFFKPQYIRRQSSPYSSNLLFSQPMIRNYFIVATRHLLRNKTLSFINILGLVAGNDIRPAHRNVGAF
jgi:putative ABC transport system permease protein